MKKLILISALCLVNVLLKAQTPKLSINIVSHNEDNYPYLMNPTSYTNIRPKLVQMAQLVAAKGAKWHLGSDHILLRAILANDNGTITASTGGMNVLRYINTTYSNNVQCDPHSHQTTYNYSDVAKFHDSLGVPPGKVISGFTYNGLMNGQDWEDYQSAKTGSFFPSYSWAPEILWGGATPGHTADPQYYGVWKPASKTNFLTHNPSNHLINYGHGCRILVLDTSQITPIMNTLRKVVNAIQTGAAPASGFYCTSLILRESSLGNSGFITTKLSNLIDSINVLVTANKMEWRTINQVVNTWKTGYGAQPFLMGCDLTVLTGVEENKLTKKLIVAYPNPVNEQLNFAEGLQDAELYNVYGQKILTLEKNATTLNTSNYTEGIYFIRSKETYLKFIVKH